VQHADELADEAGVVGDAMVDGVALRDEGGGRAEEGGVGEGDELADVGVEELVSDGGPASSVGRGDLTVSESAMLGREEYEQVWEIPSGFCLRLECSLEREG
jgi:hypothetical protein